MHTDLSHEAWSFPSESPMPDAELVEALGLDYSPVTMTFKAPQNLAVHKAQQVDRFILSYDKGMGKTVTFLRIASLWGVSRVVILCTGNAFLAIRRELRNHFAVGHRFVLVSGTAADRRKQWNSEAEFYICTYATFLADMGARKMPGTGKLSERIAPLWAEQDLHLICDEYHRALRTKDSGIFKLLKSIRPTKAVFSSGSAAGKGPQALWAVLHLCDQKRWSSYWGYVQRYCIVNETRFGKQIAGVRNISQWRRDIAPWVIHRLKDAKDYPVKTRAALPVQMEAWQKKAHDKLIKELLLVTDGGKVIVSQNQLANLIKVRQLLICPKYLDPAYGWGAGLEGIWEDMQESELTHIVVSTPFTGPIPLIEEFFRSKGVHAERLMGGDGCDADEMEKRIRRWTVHGGVMVQSIQFAESYELPAASNMYMLGYDYSPDVNSQAEDRIVRDIRVTPHPANIWYVKHERSYDEDQVERMSASADLTYVMYNKPLSELFKLSHERSDI